MSSHDDENPGSYCRYAALKVSRLYGTIQPLPDWTSTEKIYLPRSIRDFLSRNVIERILKCRCRREGCCGLIISPEQEQAELIQKIRRRYVLVLGLLTYLKQSRLILTFIRRRCDDTYFREGQKSIEELRSRLRSDVDEALLGLIEDQQKQWFIQHIVGDRLDNPFPGGSLLPLTLGEELGAGASARVYSATLIPGTHSFIGQRFAIKLFPDPIRGRAARDREYRSNREFNHAHILKALASITYKGVSMILFPAAEHDLETMMTRDDPPSMDPAFRNTQWRNFLGIASALHCVHDGNPRRYWYHGDLKPSNILVLDGKWYLADFGSCISHEWARGARNSISNSGTCLVEYAAPENRHRKGTKMRRKSEVWSLGCVGVEILVWMLNGKTGVQEFRQDRRDAKDPPTKSTMWGVVIKSLRAGLALFVDDCVNYTGTFHHRGKVNPAVLGVLDRYRASFGDERKLVETIEVLAEMLKPNPERRLAAEDTVSRLEKLYRYVL